MSNTLTLAGYRFITSPMLTFGDYGGAGDIGLANIRVVLDSVTHILETGMGTLRYASEGNPYGLGDEVIKGFEDPDAIPEAIDAYGDYNSRTVWVREDVDNEHEWTASLEDYACLSDEEAGVVTMEWEEEAWASWLKDDLLQTLHEDLQDAAEGLSDDVLWECYHRAMGETHTYPVGECSGVYVDVDRITESFGLKLMLALQDMGKL